MVLIDSYLPLIFGEWVMLGYSLLIIIALEAIVYNKFRNNWKRSFYEIAIANIVSTLLGIPISNIIRFLLMKIFAFVLPTILFPHKNEYDWEIVSPGKPKYFTLTEQLFVVFFILLVNFLVSVYSEYLVLKRLNKTQSKIELKKQSFKFNSYSYLIISILVFSYEIYADYTFRLH